jgi:formylglycine-generating enzyme required for sulfatase activity
MHGESEDDSPPLVGNTGVFFCGSALSAFWHCRPAIPAHGTISRRQAPNYRILATVRSQATIEGIGSVETDLWSTIMKPISLVLAALLFLTAVSPSAAAEPRPDPTKQITNSIGTKLTLIPSGEFMMGSKESAEETAAFFKKNYSVPARADWYNHDEHPQHRVRITKPFYLGAYHVTRGQFRQFVNDTGYKTDAEKGDKPGANGWNPETNVFDGFNEKYSWRKVGFEQTDEHPVVCVSWNDAVAFFKWLSRKECKTYRLPTEAEWEYACRADTTTRYYSGDDPETLAQVGNVADATAKAKFPYWKYTLTSSDGYVFTAPVGSFKFNAFGLYDMHGNAWQWCSDRYTYGRYTAAPVDDPSGPKSGDSRVLRGGSWDCWPNDARSVACGGSIRTADATSRASVLA